MIDLNDYAQPTPLLPIVSSLPSTSLSEAITMTSPSLPSLQPHFTPSPSRSMKRDHETMLDNSYLHANTPCLTSATCSEDMTDARAQLIIDSMGDMLKTLKTDVWYKLLLQQNKSVNDIPDVPLLAVNTFFYQVQGTVESPSDSVAADIYCLMTGFMAIYLGLIEILFHDLIKDDMAEYLSHGNPFDEFMSLFACGDDVASSVDDLFTWYHWQQRDCLVHDLRQRLILGGFQQFRSLALIDTVLTRFYTAHLLQPVAQQHQKDHGQFYTPQSVVRFMWSLCLDHPISTAGHLLLKDDLDLPSFPRLPTVFDPCMGIGAFLCEYLTRLIATTQKQTKIWNNSTELKRILAQLPETIWGVEIDPFAYKLGKLNIMVHMFPLYRQCLRIGVCFEGFSIGRLSLFRNDTLRLDLNANPYTTKDKQWEYQQLLRLRDPSQLAFDYVVTNPPYMIRKTGFVTDPDETLYDDRYLGGKGTQAYMYFMWFCLQRCHPTTGQLCFITPSQWTVLEFAENLRKWMWHNCRLLEFYQFEPYKVWPKVQTDSLIFRLCKRTPQQFDPSVGTLRPINHEKNRRQTMFLRHISRKATLTEILNAYQHFDRDRLEQQDPLINYKCTPTDNIELLLTTMHGSFAYLSPTSAVSDHLMALTRDYPRICDGERGIKGSQSPLIWHRGPNTNPVYALVVRTQWALETFGKACCDEWLRPVFYWNGKSSSPCSLRSSTSSSTVNTIDETASVYTDGVTETSTMSTSTSTSSTASSMSVFSSASAISSTTSSAVSLKSSPSTSPSPTPSTCKEVQFWSYRDHLRLTKKENSPAEAYLPFDGRNGVDGSFYSMILVDKDGANQLDKTSALYRYLHEARVALQPGQVDKELAWCHFNKCGVNVPVKIVHPINFGYFSRTQPRQRFFIDQHQRCVTNQCMYFTVKQQDQQGRQCKNSDDNEIVSSKLSSWSLSQRAWEYYYLGVLNSSIVQFFISAHCYYDQQGRTRFFSKHMAKIPHAPPTLVQVDKMQQYVQQMVSARSLIYEIIQYVESGDHPINATMNSSLSYLSSASEKQQLRSVMEKVRNCTWDLSPVDRSLLEQMPRGLFKKGKDVNQSMADSLEEGGGTLADQVIRLLVVQSLLQYAMDRLSYDIYRIPSDLRIQLEQELKLSLTLQWQIYQHHFQTRSITSMVKDILNGTLVIE